MTSPPIATQEMPRYDEEDDFSDGLSIGDSEGHWDFRSSAWNLECEWCHGIIELEAVTNETDDYDMCRSCKAQFCGSHCRYRHIVFCQCGEGNKTSGWPERWKAFEEILGGRAYSLRAYLSNSRLVIRGEDSAPLG